jgi:hypothetical protein
MEPEPVKPPAAVSFDPKVYVGEYYSDEAECTFKVIEKDNGLAVVNDAIETIPLQATAPDVFEGIGTIEFKIDAKKKVTGFNISISRANNVPFKKMK